MTSLLMVMVTGVPVSWLVQCVRLSLLSDPGLQDLEKMKSWELLKVHYSHLVDHLWPFCHVIGSIQTQRRMKFNVFYLNFSFTVRLEITGTDDRNQPFLVSWDECQSWQCLVSVRSTLTALPLARGKRIWRSARRTTGVNGSTLIRASTEKRMKNDRGQCQHVTVVLQWPHSQECLSSVSVRRLPRLEHWSWRIEFLLREERLGDWSEVSGCSKEVSPGGLGRLEGGLVQPRPQIVPPGELAVVHRPRPLGLHFIKLWGSHPSLLLLSLLLTLQSYQTIIWNSNIWV